jgi:biopolymer transport protein ExbB
MQFDLVKIFQEMDWMARGVTLVLLAMGVASLGVFIERAVAFSRSRSQSRKFAQTAGKLTAAGKYREMLETAEKLPAGHLPRMMAPAIRIHLAEGEDAERIRVSELVRRELGRQYEDAIADLRRGLNVLASVGSVAPFVGLLGTVVGIIAAFAKISTTGSGGLGSVAGGISEALVVTALGLLIAIPAVLLFNNLSARVESIAQGLTTAMGQFIDHLEFGKRRSTGTARVVTPTSENNNRGAVVDAQLA